MTESIVVEFLKSGVLGALLVVAGWWIWRMQRAAEVQAKEWNTERQVLLAEFAVERAGLLAELKEERLARVKDAKDYSQMSLSLQQQVLDSTHKMAEIYETWEQPQPATKQLTAERERGPGEHRRSDLR